MLISGTDAEERCPAASPGPRRDRRDAAGGGVAGGDLDLDHLARALRPARRPQHRPDQVATGCGRGGAARPRGTRRAAQDGRAPTGDAPRSAAAPKTG